MASIVSVQAAAGGRRNYAAFLSGDPGKLVCLSSTGLLCDLPPHTDFGWLIVGEQYENRFSGYVMCSKLSDIVKVPSSTDGELKTFEVSNHTLTITIGLTREWCEFFRSNSVPDVQQIEGIPSMQDLKRDIGPNKRQPYAAVPAMCFGDPVKDVKTIVERFDWAVKNVEMLCGVASDNQIAMSVCMFPAWFFGQYMADPVQDLPSPLLRPWWADTTCPATGDCEDFTITLTRWVHTIHYLAAVSSGFSIKSGGLKSEGTANFIAKYTASKDRAVRLCGLLRIIWEYTPLHTVIGSEDTHTMLLLVSPSKLATIFGKNRTSAVSMLKLVGGSLDSDEAFAASLPSVCILDGTIFKEPISPDSAAWKPDWTVKAESFSSDKRGSADFMMNRWTFGKGSWFAKQTVLAFYGARICGVPSATVTFGEFAVYEKDVIVGQPIFYDQILYTMPPCIVPDTTDGVLTEDVSGRARFLVPGHREVSVKENAKAFALGTNTLIVF